MSGNLESILLGAAILLLLAVAASRASSRFGIPALAMFLLLGMVAGSEGLGGNNLGHPHYLMDAPGSPRKNQEKSKGNY